MIKEGILLIRRDVLKTIVKFGRREYSEKKPLSLEVRRVKDNTVLTRGIMPSLNIRKIKETSYIIVARYAKNIRIYSFSKEGILIGGENLENNPGVIKKILSGTKLHYHLPK